MLVRYIVFMSRVYIDKKMLSPFRKPEGLFFFKNRNPGLTFAGSLYGNKRVKRTVSLTRFRGKMPLYVVFMQHRGN